MVPVITLPTPLINALSRRRTPQRDLVIEPMRRRDLRQIMPIEAAAYSTSWSRSVFETELAQARDGSRVYLVARLGREIVGYGGVWFVPDPDGDQAHVTNLVVADRQRRQGVATALLAELADAARARGCVSWTLEVRESSVGAQALYRRFGFVPVGVRKRYYENVEDAVVMWCHGLDSDDYQQQLEELRCRSSNPK